MKTNTNISFELWYSVLNESNHIVLGIKLKQLNKNITVTWELWFAFIWCRNKSELKDVWYKRLTIPFIMLSKVPNFSQHLPGFSSR